MSGEALRSARARVGWTQARAAQELGVSQGYISLLESGERQASPEVARIAMEKLGLPPTAVPAATRAVVEPDVLMSDLANLGYPGFAHVRRPEEPSRNPAAVLFDALRQSTLDARTVEALPWLVASFGDLDWSWLLPRVKALDLQNRLGFVVTLARQVAERSKAPAAAMLKERETSLESSRLVKEEPFGRSRMTEAEKRWLRTNRPEPAERWNVLSNLTAEHVRDVAAA